jgi:ligand-binding sensor domain-containing protein
MRIHILSILAIAIILCISCDQDLLRPDPIPDPSKFAANQTILEDYRISSIAFEGNGGAWIGTSVGLIHYSTTHSILYNSQNSLINSAIWDIAIDSKNNIWIGTNGLIKFDGKRFTAYNTKNSDIPDDVVNTIAIDSNDEIWITSSTRGGISLAMFDGESFEVFSTENSPLPANITTAIVIDNEDNIWVSAILGALHSYLIKISDESWTVYDSVDFKQKIFWISDLDIDSKNQVCGAIDYGLSSERFPSPHVFCFNGDNFETYSLDSTHGNFASIMVDRHDKVWYSFGMGYAYHDGNDWSKTISETTNENGNSYWKTSFRTIEEAPDGNIWVGTTEGIRIIEEKDK